MNDDALGSLSTLVAAVDELPEDFDFEVLPEEIRTILNYINTQSRHVVEAAGK